MPGDMDHTSHANHSQKADRSTFRYPKHGQVRILPKPKTTIDDPGNATSTVGVATALFGNTTPGGYYRYNPDESVGVNNAECILPESRSIQIPAGSSPQAVGGRRSEAFANGELQILKRAVRFDAEGPQQPSMRPVAKQTSLAETRESKGYGGIQRSRERGGYRGRRRGDHAVNGSSRKHQELPAWRLSLCVNTPSGKQQAQGDESSGWSMNGVPLHQRTAQPPEGYDFLPTRPGFRRVVAWLDTSDEKSAEGVNGSEWNNEPPPENRNEEFCTLSALTLRSRPTTPENCFNAGDPTTAARRRQVQRALRDQTSPQLLDAGGAKSMAMVYEEAKRKMDFVEVEDDW